MKKKLSARFRVGDDAPLSGTLIDSDLIRILLGKSQQYRPQKIASIIPKMGKFLFAIHYRKEHFQLF